MPTTRAETDLGAIRHNARTLARLAAPAALMGVVKADAYGHGAVPVARVLIEEGVGCLAVATVGEASELREAGIAVPILVFAAPLAESLAAYARLGLGVTVSSPEVVAAVIEAAAQHGPLACHVKVDTGMHRLGFAPEAVPEALQRLRDAPGVTVDALWTHLATADGDLGYARHQLATFDALVESLGPLAPEAVHVANGPALLRLRAAVARPGTFVRAGGVLYGLSSGSDLTPALRAAGLRPAMRLSTRVSHLQTRRGGGERELRPHVDRARAPPHRHARRGLRRRRRRARFPTRVRSASAAACFLLSGACAWTCSWSTSAPQTRQRPLATRHRFASEMKP